MHVLLMASIKFATSTFIILGNYFFAAASGIAGALMIILLWVYYSSQIIFFGAKYIKIRADFFNEPITFD